MKNILTLFDDPETTVFIGNKENIHEILSCFINSYKNGREMIGNRTLRNDELELILIAILTEREVPYLTNEDLYNALDIKIRKKLERVCPELVDDDEYIIL
jgi:hypothetical protein